MKNTILAIIYFIILTIAGLFLTAALPGNPTGPGTPADSTVSQLTAATTAAGTDVLYIVSGGASKKISWATLMSIIRDSLQVRNFATAGDWSFDGATFDAASNGAVIFNDSAYFNGSFKSNVGSSLFKNISPVTNDFYRIGSSPSINRWLTGVFKYVYADYFIVTNPSSPSADTLISISYDGTNLVFGPISYNVAGDIITLGSDSTVTNNLCLSEDVYTPALTTDSVITLASVTSSIVINKAIGFGLAGVEKVIMTGAGNGQLLTITNSAAYAVVMEDNATTGGNLDIGSSFTMNVTDVITLKYNSDKGRWSQLSRSDN